MPERRNLRYKSAQDVIDDVDAPLPAFSGCAAGALGAADGACIATGPPAY